MRHVYECPVRRADLHPGGTVNNVAYVDYLQEARLDVLRRHDTPVSAKRGEGLVVVGTVIEYLVPLTLADCPLYVSSWVTLPQVRAALFTLAYELFTEPADADAPVVHARATTTLTPYDFGAERPRRLTAEERERLLRIEPEPSPFADRDAPRARPPGATRPGARACGCGSDVDLLGHVGNLPGTSTTWRRRPRTCCSTAFREAAVEGHVDLAVAHTEIDYLGDEPPPRAVRRVGARHARRYDVGAVRGRDP